MFYVCCVVIAVLLFLFVCALLIDIFVVRCCMFPFFCFVLLELRNSRNSIESCGNGDGIINNMCWVPRLLLTWFVLFVLLFCVGVLCLFVCLCEMWFNRIVCVSVVCVLFDIFLVLAVFCLRLRMMCFCWLFLVCVFFDVCVFLFSC